jgi:hypothetical protein
MPQPALAIGRGMSRQPGERWTRFAGRIANAFGLVLVLVLLTYVLASVTPFKGWTAVLITAAGSVSAAVALVTAEAKPLLERWGLRMAALTVILAAIAAASGDSPPLGLSALIQMLLLSIAALSVLRAVVTESEVGFRTILGAISVYVVFILLFTFLYAGIDRLQGGAFFQGEPKLQSGDYVFFSVTTLSTTGYGNLVPAAQPGKMFSGIEMLLGQIFLVTLIAGLVSLWQPGKWVRERRRPSGGSESEA